MKSSDRAMEDSLKAALKQLDAANQYQIKQNKEFEQQSDRLEEALMRSQELEAQLEEAISTRKAQVYCEVETVRKHCKFSQERVEVQLSECAAQLDSALKEIAILRRSPF